MPIIYVASNYEMKNLYELITVPAFDFIFTGTSEACSELCDIITTDIPAKHIYTTENLDIANCSIENWNFVMNKFSLKTGAVLIIAEKEYFNTLKEGLIDDEWDSLSFDQKLF